ncbi:MAG: proprotein convertase P-domain-containing protein, partial [Saprospiraceae bacterium]|nr:proprotein convertase P-domain-containing protein [Saprospiraceae bacterium]
MQHALYIRPCAILTVLITAWAHVSCLGQGACHSPFITSAQGAGLDAIALTWLDPFAAAGKTYQLEVIPAGASPTGNPTHSGIDTTAFTATGLAPGTLHQVYIRSDCGSDVSSWNGPVLVATFIDNADGCGLALPIYDNSCPQDQEYVLWVDMASGAILGSDVLLRQVELIIAHPWIADLSISLVNPAGSAVLLTADHGVGVQNMGAPGDSTCAISLTFTESACIDIGQLQAPFTGEVRPVESMLQVHDGTNPDGAWRLQVCDKASDDTGHLVSARLVFTENMCNLPPAPEVITELDSTATLLFPADTLCDELEIVVSEDFDAHPDTISNVTFTACTGLYTITKLMPATQYVVYARRICGGDTSQWSCPVVLQTTCNPLSIVSDFDQAVYCDPVCSEACDLEDAVWFNGQGDETDWIAFEGASPTEFTGPSSARNGTGGYLYLETSG